MIPRILAFLACVLITDCSQKLTKATEKSQPENAIEEQIITTTENDEDTKIISRVSIDSTKEIFFIGDLIQLTAQVTYDDASTSNSDKNISWQSSDDEIADINNDGELTPLKTGTADITVKAENEEDILAISILPGEIGFTLWVGETDAELYLDNTDTDETLKLYISEKTGCMPKECEENTAKSLSPTEVITITGHSLKSPKSYQLSMGEHDSSAATAKIDGLFTPRNYFQASTFDNKMYIVGGKDLKGNYLTDIWSSNNGNKWTLIQDAADFSDRENHRVEAFKDSLYLTGGWDSKEETFKDIWRSSDGDSWESVNTEADFTGRDSHQLTALGDKLFLIAGWTKEGECDALNDVWQSEDGTNWEKATESAEFSKRCSHQVTAFNEKLYLTGGLEGKGSGRRYLNDVWSSANGKAWTKETSKAEFPERFNHQVISFNDALFLTGGFNGTRQPIYFNDVWQSSNGKTWTQITKSAGFEPRANHQMVVKGEYLYVISGKDGENHFHDIWRSKNGKTWQKHHRGKFIFNNL